MLLNVVDGNGIAQRVIAKGQEAIADHSGSISSGAQAQVALATNLSRSGYFIQNLGANTMFLNDTGTASAGAGSFAIPAGGTFPPEGYAVGTGAISIFGQAGTPFTLKEW